MPKNVVGLKTSKCCLLYCKPLLQHGLSAESVCDVGFRSSETRISGFVFTRYCRKLRRLLRQFCLFVFKVFVQLNSNFIMKFT